MYDEDGGSGGWGKKALLVVLGLAVPLVWWMLNRQPEEATEGGRRSPSPPEPAPTPAPPTGVSLEPMGVAAPATEAATATPAPTPSPEPVANIQVEPAAVTEPPEHPPAAVPAAATQPVAEMHQPAASEVAVDGAPVPAEVQAPPAGAAAVPVAAAPSGAPAATSPDPASLKAQTAAAAPEVAVEGAAVVERPEPEFAPGFPWDIQLSDQDGQHVDAHLLALNTRTARVRCAREMKPSEKLQLVIRSRSGDTLTPTATVSKVEGEEVELKLLRLNEGLKKRLQAFLDEQARA